jgi:hypothetical protein
MSTHTAAADDRPLAMTFLSLFAASVASTSR